MGSEENGNWSSFQLAKNTSPQSVIDNVIAPPARMLPVGMVFYLPSSSMHEGTLLCMSCVVGNRANARSLKTEIVLWTDSRGAS